MPDVKPLRHQIVDSRTQLHFELVRLKRSAAQSVQLSTSDAPMHVDAAVELIATAIERLNLAHEECL